MEILQFNNTTVIFGNKQKKALELLNKGFTRDEIKAKTNQLVAVNKASLSIEEGEIFVLMGLSGSGKSSLIRVINGLNPIASGSAKILGSSSNEYYELSKLSKKQWNQIRRKQISMVFQKFALLPWKTIADNVALGLDFCRASKREKNLAVNKYLDIIGLSKWQNAYPEELSGGMQQRVGLARALATSADILLMDEPFSALDPLIRTHLQDELLKIQKELKKTIVFVTHDFEEAIRLGNNMAIMKDGEIIQVGRPKDIIANPINDYVSKFTQNISKSNSFKNHANENYQIAQAA